MFVPNHTPYDPKERTEIGIRPSKKSNPQVGRIIYFGVTGLRTGDYISAEGFIHGSKEKRNLELEARCINRLKGEKDHTILERYSLG